jgi:hypothetical protein
MKVPNKSCEPVDIETPSRRELIENGTERASEESRPRKEPVERLLGILQLLHVREEAACFYRIDEPRMNPLLPSRERRCFGQPVERVVSTVSNRDA